MNTRLWSAWTHWPPLQRSESWPLQLHRCVELFSIKPWGAVPRISDLTSSR